MRPHRLIQNTATLLTGSGGSAVLSLLLSILIGRVLGEEGLGIYAAVLAWIFPLSLVVEFGVGTLLIRQLAGSTDPQRHAAYVKGAVRARVLLGGGMFIFILFAAPLLSDHPLVVDGLRISAPLVVLNPFYSLYTALFRARRVMRPIAVMNVGMLVVQVTLTALAFASGAGVLVALALNTVTSAGQCAVARREWRRWLRRWQRRTFESPHNNVGNAHFIPVRELLRQAMPFALASILAAVHMRAGFILLESLTNEAAVGLFAAAMRFVDGGRLPPQAFFDALFPTLAARVSDPEDFRRTFRRSTLAVFGYGVAFALVMMVVSAPLISLTYGADFAASAGVLVLVAWTLPPLMLKHVRTLYWYAYGREGFVNRVALGVALVQIGAGLLLIPAYGPQGAAVALILAECTGAVLLFMPSRSYLDMKDLP